MSQPTNSPTPLSHFLFILLLVIMGFGTQPACRVEVGPPTNGPGGGDTAAPPPSGCVNSQPIYTSGERLRGEFTVIVGEFPLRSRSLAHEYSAELRKRRINNFIFQRRKNKNWVVAVGRFTTYEQADKMRLTLVDKGFDNAEVFIPIADVIDVIKPKPLCGCY